MKKYFNYEILSSLSWILFGILLGRKYNFENEYIIFIVAIIISVLHLIKLIKILKSIK